MEEKKIRIENIEINYKIAGEGKPLLILHGWGSSAEKWEFVQARLAQEGYKVVVPDLPGFGMSEPPKEIWGVQEYKDWFLEFANKLGIQKFFLAGHSFGGQVSILVAASSPERVEKLVLLAAAGIRHEQGKRERKLERLAKLIKPLLSLLPSEALRDFVRRLGYQVIGRYDYAKAKGIMRDELKKVVREDVSSFFSQITSPTLILWGDKDKLTPVADAFIMKEHIKNSSLSIFPGIGHRLRTEAPEKLLEFIPQFLRS